MIPQVRVTKRIKEPSPDPDEIAKPMLKNQYGQYLLKVIDEMKEEINSNTFTHPEMSEIKN